MLEFSRKTQPIILIDVDDTAIDDTDLRGKYTLAVTVSESARPTMQAE